MKNKIYLAALLLSLYSLGYSEELKGTAFFETNYLKLKNNNKNFNKDKGIFPPQPENWVNIWKNKKEIFNTKYYEEKDSFDVDSLGIGLMAIGKNVNIINSGRMFLKNGGIGMTVLEEAAMENSISGEIYLESNDSVGILATSSSIGKNNGLIKLTGGNNFTQAGMGTENGSTSINNGEIIVESDNSYGMFTKNNTNKTTISINKGNINVNNTFSGIAMESEGDLSSGINEGKINISNTNLGTGMVSAQGGESVNIGEILIENSINSRGMNIGDGNSINNSPTKILNKGSIKLGENTTKSVGMRVKEEVGLVMDEGIAQNKGSILIGGDSNIGMYSNGTKTTVINDKDINLSNMSKKSFGMVGFNGASVVNNGKIILGNLENSGNMGIQVVGDNSIALNNGDIILNSISQAGINATQNGIAYNKGNININNLTPVDKSLVYGMTLGNGSLGINEGNIIINGQGTGMVFEALGMSNISVKNLETGKINITGSNSQGINIEKESKVLNGGEIKIIGDGSYGIYTIGENNEILNDQFGRIEMIGDNNFGISATGPNNSITNKGQITMSGSNNNGILAANSVVLNEGDINLNGNNNTGISVSETVLTNTGNINIAGESNTGIYAQTNSKVYNTGNISIEGSNNTGIAIAADSSLINTGKIIISGIEYTGSASTVADSNGNKAITNYGTIINSGTIVSPGELNTTDMGSGLLVMEKDSKVEAKKILGDIYISSGITIGSINDNYSTYKMFKTNEMEANLLSASILFDTKLNNNGSYYDAILTRKNFNEVIEDDNLANYLENNYITDGNQNKISLYDKFKMVSSNQQMNSLLDDTFGRSVFPTIQKQTFEMVRLNNEILKSNVSKNSIKEEFKYIVGGAYNKIDSDSLENVEGYISSLKNVWIGGEKRVTDTIKAGAILSIGDYNSNFTKNSHREDRIFQGTLFVSYDKENMNIRTLATFGGTKTDLDRESRLYNEKLKSDFDSRYFVLSNEISKVFDFKNNIYITPKANLNIYRLRQDEIRETNGQYATEIGKVKNTIIEPGVGIALGKNILLNNGYTLRPELEFNYFYRTGDLKNNLDGKIKSISDDIFTLNGYQFEKNSGDGKLKISIEKENWNVYTSYKLLFENKISSVATLGVNYKFN